MQLRSWASVATGLALALAVSLRSAEAGCPFQNPFWFVEKPVVVPVTDDKGAMVPNRVRVMWGRMENFKCVDYFQVEYFQRLNPAGTVQMTPRINRHRRSVEVEVVPCTDYLFKVIASEDWKGMREDFKMFSEVVAFRLEYTPRFVNAPVVKERRKTKPLSRESERDRLREQRRRLGAGTRDDHGGMASDDAQAETPPQLEEEEPFTIRVTWQLTDIDYPICLDHFVFEYYDTLYNETGFTRTFSRPFHKSKFELEVASNVVPCELDYEFFARAVDGHGRWTRTVWTPPACVVVTEPPSTTAGPEEAVEETTTVALPEETTPDWNAQLDAVRAENERLQAKIDGLKQEYEKIGLQVYHAFRENLFQGLEDFLARRKARKNGGNGDGNGGLFGVGGEPITINTTTASSSFFG